MKTFETPYVDVVKFNVADILTASTAEAEETTEYDPVNDWVWEPPCA